MDDLLVGLRAAAESTRLRLLALCTRAELSVSELTQILGQSQPRVSRHLKLLCEAGLLDRFREGTHAYFRVADAARGGRLARLLIDQIPADDATVALDIERLEAIERGRARTAAAYFRKNAAKWDQVRSLYVEEETVERALLDLMPADHIKRLLDIGTGTGRILALFAGRAEHAVGVDLSREMLAVARANLRISDLHNCVVRHGDMYQLPWPAESFDAVTIHQVLHFAEDPDGAIAEAARVLRPDGWLAVVDFAPHGLEDLRERHAHRWLGFEDREILGWYRAAGLAPGEAVHLPGDPLTVGIWPATRTRSGRARRRRTAREARP